ncbi:MAG: hypothetical protein IPI01_05285 [Ignavibacteriae bacterium]|nr:hypothetical protein [Ignavibacteriota bacterium]
MISSSRTTRCFIIACCLAVCPPRTASSTGNDNDRLSFPFAPARHVNAIGLPDDWHKPLVTGDGSLAYDFGPGPYATPLTEIGFHMKAGPDTVAGQWYDDPRVPIACTQLKNGANGLTVEAFTVIPPRGLPPPFPAAHGRIRRPGGLERDAVLGVASRWDRSGIPFCGMGNEPCDPLSRAGPARVEPRCGTRPL